MPLAERVGRVGPAGARADEARLLARLRRAPRAELLAMYEAAAEATECLCALARSGRNPVTEALGGTSMVEEWAHFPSGDVVDPQANARYYYHAHAADDRADGEHGHFHTFVCPRALGPALVPAAPQGREDEASAVAHLVGISTDARGRIMRLFTTNRWVTGEVWCEAAALLRMLDRFDIATDEPSRHLNRWVTAMTRTFRPQIADLIQARDRLIAERRAADPQRDPLEDRGLQVITEMPVDFLAQVRAIETALGDAAHGQRAINGGRR